MDTHGKLLSGNPILRRRGVCDPHVRIFNDRAWLYATHDKSPDSTTFVMEDWWVWSSPDLVNWTHECTLRPEDTYIGPGFTSCWATDAAERNGRYYWYFSEANRSTGVVVGETPAGPSSALTTLPPAPTTPACSSTTMQPRTSSSVCGTITSPG